MRSTAPRRAPAARRPRWRGPACRAAAAACLAESSPRRTGRRRAAPGRPGEPGATVPWSSTEAASASRGVSACSGCHGSRSSPLRWTAAAIASHGSSGETGASEPIARVTPSSSIQRSAKQRSARSGQTRSVASRSSSRCAGWTLARMPRSASRRTSVAPDQLGVLDRAPGAGRGVGVQRVADRGVADRVRGDLEVVLARPGEQLVQLVGGLVGRAAAGPVGVRLAAPGGPGVQRPVGDHLERAHRDPLVAAGQHVAGAQAGVDHGVEAVGVRRHPDPQQVGALGEPLGPLRCAAAELEVDDAGDAHGRGGLEGALVRRR